MTDNWVNIIKMEYSIEPNYRKYTEDMDLYEISIYKIWISMVI